MAENKAEETSQKTPEQQYKDDLKAFHKASARHVLVAELEIEHNDAVQHFGTAEKLRHMGNELSGIMKKNLEQLTRTKKYRNLKRLYGKYKNEVDAAEKELKELEEQENIKKSQLAKVKKVLKEADVNRNNIGKQLNELYEKYNVTWDYCRTKMIDINKVYKVDAVYALTKAEDIWSGVEKCLFGNGEALHFAKRGDLPCIRAKQFNRGVIIKNIDSALKIKIDNKVYDLKLKDKFQNDEVDAIVNYMNNSGEIDQMAVKAYKEHGVLADTYRPCYASLVCEELRGRLRIYVHITIEGRPMRKYKRDGITLRHTYGVGQIGDDIGTQTTASTAPTAVGLKNLAERGRSIETNERQERILQRSMDRSQRAMNPNNYNEDGTIKKGKKDWIKSKRQKKREKKHKAKCRINSINRHLAINEEVNRMRSLGNVFITEPKNAKQLQQRVEVVNEKTDQIEHHKNHGKAIQTRCPGYYQSRVATVFETTGGKYFEVPYDFRASQYDHTNDSYTKRDLYERIIILSDGTAVQRDWYSSFLMHCSDVSNPNNIKIDRKMCLREFPRAYAMYLEMIKEIEENGIDVKNSGILVAHNQKKSKRKAKNKANRKALKANASKNRKSNNFQSKSSKNKKTESARTDSVENHTSINNSELGA